MNLFLWFVQNKYNMSSYLAYFLLRSLLIETGLLHDSQKLLLIDLAIVIEIGFVDHLLKLFVGQIFAQLFGHSFQILEADLAILVVIEQSAK